MPLVALSTFSSPSIPPCYNSNNRPPNLGCSPPNTWRHLPNLLHHPPNSPRHPQNPGCHPQSPRRHPCLGCHPQSPRRPRSLGYDLLPRKAIRYRIEGCSQRLHPVQYSDSHCKTSAVTFQPVRCLTKGCGTAESILPSKDAPHISWNRPEI
jgi:hypothetical protein